MSFQVVVMHRNETSPVEFISRCGGLQIGELDLKSVTRRDFATVFKTDKRIRSHKRQR